MHARSKLKPGQKGTHKLLEQYGQRLFCVRYRYDEARKKRYKTVELIVEESDWSPPSIKAAKLVAIQIERQEYELQRRVKQAGGKWHPEQKVWLLSYGQVVTLGLEDRIKQLKVSSIRNRVKSGSL